MRIIEEREYLKDIIGTKARNLVLMQNAGMNVPRFVCVKENDNDELENIESIFGKDYKVSVRSSCGFEDSMDNSFAGQFETTLNVTKENVKEAVISCFKSQNSENVKEYLAIKKMKNVDTKEKSCVIIQQMLNPEKSGVLFTANPQGILNEMVIVVGEGVGANVVEDKVPTTSYYYSTEDKVYYADSQEGAATLTDEEIKELVRLAKKIEEMFGEYQDIEYAIEDGKIYILQARKITTLDLSYLTVLDNSNITESYPATTLQLTQSFVKEVYYQVVKNAVFRLTKNKKLIESMEGTFREMVVFCNGTAYYKINNWYKIIKILPFSDKIIPMWQEMLGIENKYVTSDEVKISGSIKRKVISSFFKLLKTNNKEMESLDVFFNEMQEKYKTTYSSDLSSEELVKYYEDFKDEVSSKWDITLVNDMYAFIYTALVKKQLKKEAGDRYQDYSNQVIASINNLESMKPIEGLINLSIYAKEKDLLEALVSIDTNEEVEDALNKCNNEEFKTMFYSYIENFGDRNVEELKLESKTFRTDPVILVKRIVDYIKDDNLEHYITTSNALVESINLSKKTRKYMVKAQLGIANREKSRLNRTRLYGIMRTIVLDIAAHLVEDGVIEEKADIFYLSYEKLQDVISGKMNADETKEYIKEVKLLYSKYNTIPRYSRIVFTGEIINKNPLNIVDKVYINPNVLEGVACSSGIVEGEVVFVNKDNIETVDVKDKIILTEMTDPGWVYVISQAKGLIVEKGSILSHSAIISRELGKPAVVGVKNVTRILKDGAKVKLDAVNGKIEVKHV